MGDQLLTPMKKCLLKGANANFRFIFVREPMKRLYSAWADKIYRREGHQFYYTKINRAIFARNKVKEELYILNFKIGKTKL